MVGYDLGHEQRNLVWRVELASLLPGVRGKHADQILVDESQDVVALFAVHRNDFYQLDQVADSLCLRAGTVAELGEAGLQGVEYAVEDFFMRVIDKAAESL